MTSPRPLDPVALDALPLPQGGGAPDAVMLLPAPFDRIRTVDGRGPFRVDDPAALVAASRDPERNGGRLVIDVNHSTDRRGKLGGEAPARGWITALQVRPDGIWAEVEWTKVGRSMVAEGEYRSISPVIVPDAEGRVLRILRAGLTNDPALLGLATLTTAETPMKDLHQGLAERLGKPATATAEELLTAVPDPQAQVALTALQAEVSTLCAALGVSDLAAALPAVEALQARGAEVGTLQARLAALEAAQKRQAAEAWMAGEIAARRAIPVPKRERLIELFVRDPGEARSIASTYPTGAEIAHLGSPPPAGGAVALTAEQAAAATALGVSPADFLKTLQAEQKEAR